MVDNSPVCKLRDIILEREECVNNPELRKAIIKASDDVISKAPDKAQDATGFHIALGILGATIILSVFGVLVLTYIGYQSGKGIQIPELVSALGTTAIGAVAGLVVSPSLKSSKP